MKFFAVWVGLLIVSWITSAFFTIINTLSAYESLGLTAVIFFSSLLYVINKYEII
ncbi:hypothetical protein [Macrococcus armenti]|uniref:hypothetical protein n=1 Tax=Macrococcus armenti TaxID=2875764 RepID=UPI001CCECD80|nr:hypothetical protein [Macrococcus armenti]UBH16369.1 hypothetical protein LAU44_05285 [Macrococcus armenti]UBH18725.1 hypothetical protein LAU39_05295 [Macrococcus armenti]UBH20997.1 hypothetical protein LAU40_05290 [Macrococcus armenti]